MANQSSIKWIDSAVWHLIKVQTPGTYHYYTPYQRHRRFIPVFCGRSTQRQLGFLACREFRWHTSSKPHGSPPSPGEIWSGALQSGFWPCLHSWPWCSKVASKKGHSFNRILLLAFLLSVSTAVHWPISRYYDFWIWIDTLEQIYYSRFKQGDAKNI